MSAKFTCQYCDAENISTFPICKKCKKQQRGLPIRIPKGSTKEEIDLYMKEYMKLSNNVSKKGQNDK